jgi:xanthine dehydrogenase YagR molybdenum-binding subunit
VWVRIGDSRLVRGPRSGGSVTTATLVPATLEAVAGLRRRLLEQVRTADGVRDARLDERGIRHADGHIAWAEALASAPTLTALADRPDDVPAASHAERPWAGTGLAGRAADRLMRWLLKVGTGRGYTGAVHVSEVEVDTLLATARVLRVAAGIAAGRVAAPELARSQCYGGVIQGIGYALYEQRHDDQPSGIVLSAGLEDYRIPGIGDTPEIEIHFDEKGFEHVRGGGVGLGELSTVAVAASIGNAVHNATGWRPYDLPIRPDRLLEGTSR